MTTYSGRISAPHETDTFSVKLHAGRQYAVGVEGSLILGLNDPALVIRHNGHVIAHDDDSGYGLQPFLAFEPRQTGRYTFEVSGYGTSTGSYVLSVQDDDFRNAYDGSGSAGALTAARALHGAIDYGNDTDIVTATLIKGLSYTFELRGASTQDGSLGDPRLALLGRDGAELASDDDGGYALNSQITYLADATGRHYLEASAYGSATGDYRIAVGAGQGTAGGDRVNGSNAADAVDGLGGADRIAGAKGDDVLQGGDGNDRLSGGDGDDTLRGGAGNDDLNGGRGADLLIGGTGHDHFEFGAAADSAPGHRDTIRGGDGAVAFEGAGAASGDVIDVSGIDARAGVAGDQAFAFDGGHGVGHLWAADAGGVTVIRGNTGGDGAPEFELRIEDDGVLAAAYEASDFIL